MHVDTKLMAEDATYRRKWKRLIRCLRDPNPMEDIPDPESTKNPVESFNLILLPRVILVYWCFELEMRRA